MKRSNPVPTYRIRENPVERLLYWDVPELMSEEGIMVVFTGRLGGFSKGPFSELNLSYNVGDDHDNVISNRDLVARLFGFNVEDYTFCKQIHKTNIVLVGEDERGKGSKDYSGALDGCDVLVTKNPGAVLGVLIADCLPIILVEPDAGGVAAVHAGWRGTLMGVAAKGVQALCDHVGSNPKKVAAFMGPSLCFNCLELDRQASGDYPERDERGYGLLHGGEGKYHLDLPDTNSRFLEEAGVRRERIFRLDICTKCNGEILYSHRGSGGTTGRQAALVSIREP